MTTEAVGITDIALLPAYNIGNGNGYCVTFSVQIKNAVGTVLAKVVEYIVIICNILLSEYTKDVVWTGVQVFFALIVLATLSLATIFITVIINVNEAMKKKNEGQGDQMEDVEEKIDKTYDNFKIELSSTSILTYFGTVVGDYKEVKKEERQERKKKRPGSQSKDRAPIAAIY